MTLYQGLSIRVDGRRMGVGGYRGTFAWEKNDFLGQLLSDSRDPEPMVVELGRGNSEGKDIVGLTGVGGLSTHFECVFCFAFTLL